jgi:hypothetical protein
MLKYKCLVCGIEWGDPQATESEISHGYCPICIRERYTERIHQAQVQAGYCACFNSGCNDCGEERCCFRAACQDELIASWKRAVIGRIEVTHRENLICDVVIA